VKDLNGKNNGPVVSNLVTGGKVIMALPPATPGHQGKTGDQMYVQVTPQEAVDLEAALATGAHISCATRPAIAGVQTGPLPIPSPDPTPDVIEILSGKSSRRETLPSSTTTAEDSSSNDAKPSGNKPAQPAEPEPKKQGSAGER
jgi:hypothetical protein